MVEPIASETSTISHRLEGLGVSPGHVRGRVRVLTDPSTGEQLEPGEILVCVATNPSYASYFLVAAGVVTDIGGALGHGAIVAREVGIPCVVNTEIGSRTLRTGDEIEIDGSTGQIEIITRAKRLIDKENRQEAGRGQSVASGTSERSRRGSWGSNSLQEGLSSLSQLARRATRRRASLDPSVCEAEASSRSDLDPSFTTAKAAPEPARKR
jgi:phosphoenolpyruvate synthase/pyruvate phosphate dikinase